MKSKNLDRTLISIAVIGILLIFAGLFFSDGLNITAQEFDDCRIIKPGNVCDDYFDCYYSSNEDASCINGYEDKTIDYDNVEILFSSPDEKKQSTCYESGYDWCYKSDVDSVFIAGDNIPYFVDSVTSRKYLYNSFFDVKAGLSSAGYVYDLNENQISCNNNGCFNVVHSFDFMTTLDLRKYANENTYKIKPSIVAFEGDPDDSDYYYAYASWSENFYIPSQKCFSDADCMNDDYCNKNYPFETYCSKVSCTYEVINHVCTSYRFPNLCTSAGITEYPPCVTYLKDYADDLSAQLPDLIEQIDQLELDIADKQDIINTLTSDFNDLKEEFSSLQLTTQQQAGIIFWLRVTQNQQAQLIDSLNITIQEKAEIIYLLEATSQEKQDIIDALNLEIADLRALLDSLQDLNDTLGEQEVENANLIGALKDKIYELENSEYVFNYNELLKVIKENYILVSGVLLILLLSVWAIVKTKRLKK